MIRHYILWPNKTKKETGGEVDRLPREDKLSSVLDVCVCTVFVCKICRHIMNINIYMPPLKTTRGCERIENY